MRQWSPILIKFKVSDSCIFVTWFTISLLNKNMTLIIILLIFVSNWVILLKLLSSLCLCSWIITNKFLSRVTQQARCWAGWSLSEWSVFKPWNFWLLRKGNLSSCESLVAITRNRIFIFLRRNVCKFKFLLTFDLFFRIDFIENFII